MKRTGLKSVALLVTLMMVLSLVPVMVSAAPAVGVVFAQTTGTVEPGGTFTLEVRAGMVDGGVLVDSTTLGLGFTARMQEADRGVLTVTAGSIHAGGGNTFAQAVAPPTSAVINANTVGIRAGWLPNHGMTMTMPAGTVTFQVDSSVTPGTTFEIELNPTGGAIAGPNAVITVGGGAVTQTGIAITGPSSVATTSNITLGIAAVPAGAASPELGATWVSSNTAVATVNPTTGVVTGVTEGTTVITATSTFNSAWTATRTITVADVIGQKIQMELRQSTRSLPIIPGGLETVFPGQVIEANIFLQDIENADSLTIPLAFDPDLIEITGLEFGPAAILGNLTYLPTGNNEVSFFAQQFMPSTRTNLEVINDDGMFFLTLNASVVAGNSYLVNAPTMVDPINNDYTNTNHFFTIIFRVSEDLLPTQFGMVDLFEPQTAVDARFANSLNLWGSPPVPGEATYVTRNELGQLPAHRAPIILNPVELVSIEIRAEDGTALTSNSTELNVADGDTLELTASLIGSPATITDGYTWTVFRYNTVSNEYDIAVTIPGSGWTLPSGGDNIRFEPTTIGRYRIIATSVSHPTVRDYHYVTVIDEVEAVLTITGTALLYGIRRYDVAAAGWTWATNQVTVDAGIRVEFVHIASGDVVATTYTANRPGGAGTNYELEVELTSEIVDGLRNATPVYMLRFTRRYVENGSRDARFLVMEMPLRILGGDLTVDTGVEITGLTVLAAGAFFESDRVASRDVTVIRALVGIVDGSGDLDIFDINQILGVDPGDYASVLSSLGRNPRLPERVINI